MTPAARSIDLLRAHGYTVDICERVNRGAASRGVVITHDLFGFGDLIAVRSDLLGVLLVQVTAGGHGPQRERKIRSLRAAQTWLRAGNRIEVHDWRRRKVRRGVPLERVELVRTVVALQDAPRRPR